MGHTIQLASFDDYDVDTVNLEGIAKQNFLRMVHTIQHDATFQAKAKKFYKTDYKPPPVWYRPPAPAAARSMQRPPAPASAHSKTRLRALLGALQAS